MADAMAGLLNLTKGSASGYEHGDCRHQIC
jgi:hypothetical protein